jgi:crotonobetainyl-CoA:carnitine CoA-transferase CaiB-like acyl-CoA transferase
VGNDAQFARACAVLGLPELAADPRFVTNKSRVVNRVELIARLSAATLSRPTRHWVAAFEGVGVPAGPINSLDAVFDDPQVRARNMQVELPHPVSGTVPLVANPLRFSQTPVSYRSAPPLLGAQTREILIERLGMSEADIEKLRAQGVI